MDCAPYGSSQGRTETALCCQKSGCWAVEPGGTRMGQGFPSEGPAVGVRNLLCVLTEVQAAPRASCSLVGSLTLNAPKAQRNVMCALSGERLTAVHSRDTQHSRFSQGSFAQGWERTLTPLKLGPKLQLHNLLLVFVLFLGPPLLSNSLSGKSIAASSSATLPLHQVSVYPSAKITTVPMLSQLSNRGLYDTLTDTEGLQRNLRGSHCLWRI